MNLRIRSLVAIAIAGLSLSALRADPMDAAIVMGFDQTSFRQDNPGSISGTTVAGGSLLTHFSFDTGEGLFEGDLGVTVLEGATENDLGGLTFVYEIKNTSTEVPSYHGVSLFQVAGWSDLLIAMDLGNSYFFEPVSDPNGVFPFDFVRQTDLVGAGGLIKVTYPEDSNGPPIFPGQNSLQMIIHTNATTFGTVNAQIALEAFNGQGVMANLSVATFSAAVGSSTPAVPDGGMTLVLLGAAFVALAGFAPRWQAAKTRL